MSYVHIWYHIQYDTYYTEYGIDNISYVVYGAEHLKWNLLHGPHYLQHSVYDVWWDIFSIKYDILYKAYYMEYIIYNVLYDIYHIAYYI